MRTKINKNKLLYIKILKIYTLEDLTQENPAPNEKHRPAAQGRKCIAIVDEGKVLIFTEGSAAAGAGNQMICDKLNDTGWMLRLFSWYSANICKHVFGLNHSKWCKRSWTHQQCFALQYTEYWPLCHCLVVFENTAPRRKDFQHYQQRYF